ncbi:hypothetical protein [Flaviaesturariibacter terrae]
MWQASAAHEAWKDRLRHFTYAGGWKKFEPLWNFLIKTGGLNRMLPLLESILSTDSGRKRSDRFAPAIA